MTSTPDPAPMSIGEVLSVLQSEFPDVTISKIRFLESQGLVRPERNASGYRQFASGDIERLTWILRQQRDHFLPLKVIKKALDRGVEVPDAGDGEQPTLWSAAADAVVADELSHQRATDAAEAAVAAETAEVAEPSGHPADGSAGRDVTRRAPVPVAVPAGASHAPPDEDPGQGRGTRRHSTPADVVAALQEEPRSVRSKNAGSQPRAASAGHDSAPPGSEERRPAGSTPSAGAPDPEPAPAAVPVGRPVTDRGDLQHTRDELLALAGVDEELLDGLEEFGLVVATLDAGEAVYDNLALQILRSAARFAELGVEPRHLRMYKVSAEREAGFIEQLVMPLLKQRNPEARARARESARELLELGALMHAAVLARELGPDVAP